MNHTQYKQWSQQIINTLSADIFNPWYAHFLELMWSDDLPLTPLTCIDMCLRKNALMWFTGSCIQMLPLRYISQDSLNHAQYEPYKEAVFFFFNLQQTREEQYIVYTFSAFVSVHYTSANV